MLSAALSGLAGGLFAISHGFASLQEVNWTTSGFDGIGIVTGTVFVLVVLLFRQGLWGGARQLAAAADRTLRRRRKPPEPDSAEAVPVPSTTTREEESWTPSPRG